MIENKFLYFQTYADFKEKLDGGYIDRGSVAFIEDESIIWTHDKEFVHNIVSPEAIISILNTVLEKMEDITGEQLHGIKMTVEPTYYSGEDGCELHITASLPVIGGVYDKITFYDGENVIEEFENWSEPIDITYTITDSTTIKCVAIIAGEEYTAEKHISKVTEFYIGGGTTVSDVMIEEYRKDIVDSLEGSYELTLENGDNIIIVMDSAYESLFSRADMNGFEIPFEKRTFIDENNGVTYTVYTSINQYAAGTYNIYINK